jgi:HSP20 family protein
MFETFEFNRNSFLNLNSSLKDMFDYNTKYQLTETIPKANLFKDEKGYTINLAAPGFSRSDFDISIKNNFLKIKIDNKITTDKNKLLMQEFDFNSFERVWKLPKNINTNLIEANYMSGILSIYIPFSEPENNTFFKIEVK